MELETSVVLYTVNLTPDSPLLSVLTYWLWKTIPVTLLTIGTFGNLLNLVILSRRNMRKYTTPIFLTFLACADLVTLWFLTLRSMVWYYSEIDIKVSSPSMCAMHDYLTYASGGFSSWLLALLTLERVLYTSFPVISKARVTRKNALITCISTLVVSMSLCAYLPFGFSIKEFNVMFRGVIIKHIKQCLPNPGYDVFHDGVWNILVFVSYGIIPLITITVGNCVIICKLRKNRTRVHPRMTTATNASQERQSAATKTLLLLSIFYIITTLPHCVFDVVEMFLPKTMQTSAPHVPLLQFGRAMTHFLLCGNFTFNFVLYFLNGSLFKKEWILLVSDVKQKGSSIFAIGNTRASRT